MNPALWRMIGFLGQTIFGSRFLVQWIWSERHRRSVIPGYFWYASMVGGVALLIYAIHIKDPVFALGQCFGVFVYGRNLVLMRRRPSAVASLR